MRRSSASLACLGILAACLVTTAARAAVAWDDVLRQPAAWYASAEAAGIADNVLVYQRDVGGWPKNHDMTRPPDAHAFDHDDVTAPTIDNGATYTQIRFLARVDAAHPVPAYRAAMESGLQYLLRAQYGNGGWPQFYPLRPGYYTHITFNDDAMVGVLELLRDVAAGRSPFDWAPAALRRHCAAAVTRGITCILRCQIEVNGVKTVWCAQHDERTFEPVPARAYEHESLSGMESVGIVRFLMGEEHPNTEVRQAIEAAVRWFRQARIDGVRIEHVPAAGLPHGYDVRVVPAAEAKPVWARFYEIGTNRPIFGGRDTRIHYSLAEIDPERRGGYNWYTNAPARLLDHDYPEWVRRQGAEAAPVR